MPSFNLVVLTSTSLSFELSNSEIYETTNPYDVFLNDERVCISLNKNVFSLYGLKPDTDYELKLIFENGEACAQTFRTETESVALDVRRFNAKGDGQTDDTQAIQAAIMSAPIKGRVVIPPGTYKVKTLFLKSDLTLDIQKGATLIYDGKFHESAILPGYTKTASGEYYLGSWEGNPLDTYSALIQGINVENVQIIGEGILDGNGANWWDYPKQKVGAWRPRLFQLIHSQNVLVQGVTFQNSPSWTIHPLLCSYLTFVDLNILNPKDSPNTDGLNPESCQHVLILGVHFSVGDDCIAIKSGKIYLGRTLKRPSSHINIRNCSMNFGHGAVTIGSEIAGGVNQVEVTQCLFNETDRGLRIKTRRGRGQDAVIEAITFKNIQMTGVLSPVVINAFYFCDPDGHSDYVKSKSALPVDERTPVLKDFVFEQMDCQGIQVAAGFFYGLPEAPIEKVSLKNCHFAMAKTAEPGYPAMMDDISMYAKAGLLFNHIKQLEMERISFQDVDGAGVSLNQIQEVKDNDCTENCG